MSCIGLSITHSYASNTIQVVSEVAQVLLFKKNLDLKNINLSEERKMEKKRNYYFLQFVNLQH